MLKKIKKEDSVPRAVVDEDAEEEVDIDAQGRVVPVQTETQ